MPLFLPPLLNKILPWNVTNRKTPSSNVCSFSVTLPYVFTITQFCIWKLPKLLFRVIIFLFTVFISTVFLQYFLLPFLSVRFSPSVISGVSIWMLHCHAVFPQFSLVQLQGSISLFQGTLSQIQLMFLLHSCPWNVKVTGWSCHLTVMSVSDTGGQEFIFTKNIFILVKHSCQMIPPFLFSVQ